MIEEKYVPFKVARLLRDKGFDEKTVRCYNLKKELCACQCNGNETINSTPNNLIAAPTQQMVMSWLREVHGIHLVPIWKKIPNKIVYTGVKILMKDKGLEMTPAERDFPPYETLMDAAICYCLEKIL